MSTFYLQAELTFVCTDAAKDTDGSFDAFTDLILDELLNLTEFDEGFIDPDMAAVITERRADVVVVIEAGSQTDAMRIFSANLRTALHAAGCATAGWSTDLAPVVRKAEALA